MRSSKDVFHLAIPCRSLEETRDFYERLGCRIARVYDDRITLDFFGDQIVCHLSPDDCPREVRMYPRHFGITFQEEDGFRSLLNHCRNAKLPFYQEPFTRFEGRKEQHQTFFLVDPSNNVLEFKYYDDPSMMY